MLFPYQAGPAWGGEVQEVVEVMERRLELQERHWRRRPPRWSGCSRAGTQGNNPNLLSICHLLETVLVVVVVMQGEGGR